MSILRDKRPSVHSLLGCKLPRPRRTFGIGLVDFPDGPYDDEPNELPLSAYHEVDEPESGDIFWNSELEHLEGLLASATPARRTEIEKRIDGVLGMLGLPTPTRTPRLYEPEPSDRLWWAMEREREERESYERQLAASWALDQIEAGAQRHDWEEQEACRVVSR